MTVQPSDINRPDVVAEIQAMFAAYECDYMGNRVDALVAHFWHDQGLTRYGIADRQLGFDEQRAYRQATPAPQFTRQLHNLRIQSFGPDMAVAMVEFVRSDTALRGFQTQTWVRLAEGWRIVAAHVSMIPWPPA